MSRVSFNNLQEYSMQIQALVENEIAEAKIKVIKIPATQALSQNPPQVWLTDDQYDQMFGSYEFVLDGSEIGFGFTKWYKSYDSTNEWFYSSMVAPGSFNYYLSFDYDGTNNRYIVTVNTQASTNIPTVTITSDNIDQTTGDIILDSEQRDVLNNNFIVRFDASIVSYPIIQGYKIWWDSDNVQFVAGASMTGSTWSYTRISVDENNLFVVGAYELNSSFDPTNTDNSPITSSVVTQALNAYNATATGVTSGSTLPDTIIRSFVSDMLPIQINGALCHFVNFDTSTRVARYFTATMNGALVHLNIIEINTSTWVVTFNQVDVGASPNVDQDLTTNTCFTLDATAFASLVSTHTATVASPVFTGLSNTYEFVTIKASINSTNYNIKLCRNDTSKYSGLFFIEDSSHLYELTLYYNGTSVYLRCATVY